MRNVTIGAHSFLNPKEPYILAEIGLNHNGNLDLALRSIDAAKEAGAQGVKFQSYFAEEFLHSSQEAALEVFRKCELSPDEFGKLGDHCRQVGIDFISTPLSFSYVSILDQLGVDAIKIASGDMNYFDMIEAATATKRTLIISTGMGMLSEIDHLMSQNFLVDYPLVLLHCISNYPPMLEDIHLRFVHTLSNLYPVPIGLSDHSVGNAVPLGAIALGALFIEKHFTLDCELEGPDHKMSIMPDGLKELVKGCQDVFHALGEWKKPVIQDEVPVKNIARRGLYLDEGVSPGDLLTNENARFLRPPNGINPEEVRLLKGSWKLTQEQEAELLRSHLEKSENS